MKKEDKKLHLMGEEFKKRVKYSPNVEFLVDWVTGKGERRLTYKQVAESVYKLCWAMRDIGVKKGDTVAIIGYNLIEGIEVVIASTFMGFVFGWQNPDLPDDFLVTVVNDRMAARVIFFEDAYRDKIKRLMPRFKSAEYYVSLNGPSEDKIISYREFITKYEPKEFEVEVEPDELHCLYMSSGTTGPPKAAMWTHEANWYASYYAFLMFEVGPEELGAYVSPSFWSTWVVFDLWDAVLGGAGAVVFDGRHDLDIFCEAVAKEKISFGIIPAFIYLYIASWPEEKWKKYDLSSLQRGFGWGITIPVSVRKVLQQRWGITGGAGGGYSSCEFAGGMQASFPSYARLLERGEEKKLSSPYGIPAANALVKIVDFGGNEVGVGEIGELIMRAPSMFCGYLGQPEKTAEKLRDGWYYSGEMVKRDEDGYIYLEGKKEDIGMFPVDKHGKYIMPYGMQVAVTGIEGVIEAAAISVPNPEYQAKYVIVARLKEGAILSKEKIIETASSYVPHYLIEDVVFRKEEIPKTPSGKIVVRELAKEYGGIIPEE